MVNSNPLQNLQSMGVTDIQGTSDSYKGMLMTQINRITYLLTMGNAKYEGVNQMFSDETLAKSSLRGIQILEAMITPIMNTTYEEETRPIKQNLIKLIKQIPSRDLEFYDYYTQWLTIIIRHLDKLNMLPEEEIELDFD